MTTDSRCPSVPAAATCSSRALGPVIVVVPSGQVEHRCLRAAVLVPQLGEIPEGVLRRMMEPFVVVRRNVAQLLDLVERQRLEQSLFERLRVAGATRVRWV